MSILPLHGLNTFNPPEGKGGGRIENLEAERVVILFVDKVANIRGSTLGPTLAFAHLKIFEVHA